MPVFEVILKGFNAHSSNTDELVKWVRCSSEARLRLVLKNNGCEDIIKSIELASERLQSYGFENGIDVEVFEDSNGVIRTMPPDYRFYEWINESHNVTSREVYSKSEVAKIWLSTWLRLADASILSLLSNELDSLGKVIASFDATGESRASSKDIIRDTAVGRVIDTIFDSDSDYGLWSAVRVTQLVKDLSNQDDMLELPAGQHGIGSSLDYDVPPVYKHIPCPESAVLDWFHSECPIGCLDDFEISVIPISDHRGLLKSNSVSNE